LVLRFWISDGLTQGWTFYVHRGFPRKVLGQRSPVGMVSVVRLGRGHRRIRPTRRASGRNGGRRERSGDAGLWGLEHVEEGRGLAFRDGRSCTSAETAPADARPDCARRVGASAPGCAGRRRSRCLGAPALRPPHLHQHACAARAQKYASMACASVISLLPMRPIFTPRFWASEG